MGVGQHAKDRQSEQVREQPDAVRHAAQQLQCARRQTAGVRRDDPHHNLKFTSFVLHALRARKEYNTCI